MVGHQVLVLSIEVRVLVHQLILKTSTLVGVFSMQAEGNLVPLRTILGIPNPPPHFKIWYTSFMKIGIIGSMQYTEQMLAMRDKLNTLGHEAFVTDLHKAFIGKTDEEKEEIKIHQKNNLDAIREFWNMMQGADAVLVLNLDKNGIKNYIGGNTFLEIGFAHVLNQKIFLLNPVPDIQFYKTEIEAMRPIVINGDLSLIHP